MSHMGAFQNVAILLKRNTYSELHHVYLCTEGGRRVEHACHIPAISALVESF
jgi:hypothetical protein